VQALLEPLLSHGVLGIVAAISLWFGYLQTGKTEACQEKRVTDIERVLAAITASTQAVLDNTESTKRVVEEVQRLNDRRTP